ncbi:MAG: hypothetical protein ABI414_01070 [Devosia sp.]
MLEPTETLNSDLLSEALRHGVPTLPFVANHDFPVPDALRNAVMLLGNFDGIHLGHAGLLKRARHAAEARELPLGIMSCEPHPRQFLAPHGDPFRLSSMAGKRLSFANQGIDLLYQPAFDAAMASRSPQSFVAEVLVDYLGISSVVVGRDFRFGHKRAGDVPALTALGRSLGFSVEVVDDIKLDCERLSSTRIRAWIAAGDIRRATGALCGSWLTSVSITEDGYVLFESHQLLPPPGAYQVGLVDRGGTPLGFEIVTLTDTRHAHLATNRVPAGSYLVTDWRSADFS